jgi:Family of unknown function (DUF6629)
MCFAPEVDVVAAVVITGVAVDAIRHNHSARTAPLAVLPALFAVHTLASAFVWWGLDGSVPSGLGAAATSFYLAIAFVVLPVLVPVAVLLIEPPGWRRPALVVLGLAGAYASAAFALGLLDGRGEATACSYYIDFGITGASSFAGVMYVAATCGALLLSGQRPLVVWGITNVVVVGLLVLLEANGLPSLWCFWAACTSVFIAWFLRSLAHARAAGAAWPWAPA